MKKNLFLVFALIVLTSCGNSTSGKLVTKQEFGKKWAFTVKQGYTYSIGESAIFNANGTEYQLNGAARMQGYKSIDSIWRENPEIPGTKVSISPFIDLALKNPKK